MWIDVARGWCMLAIVIGHTYLPWDKQPALFAFLYAFHVPAFFFLSGLTFSGGKLTWGTFLRRRARTLLLPYVVWALVSVAVYQVLGAVAANALNRGTPPGLLDSLGQVLLAIPSGGRMEWNTPLWFLPALFLTSLLGYVVSRWRHVWRLDTLWLWLPASLVLSVWLQTHTGLGLPWSADRAGVLAPYFFLGLACRSRLLSGPVGHRGLQALGGTVVLAVTAWYAVTWTWIDYVAEQYATPTQFLLVSAAGICGVVLVSRAAQPALVTWIGQRTLGVLVVHKFPVVALQMVLALTVPLSAPLWWDGLLVVALGTAITVVSGLAAQVIEGVAPWALGRPSSRGRRKA